MQQASMSAMAPTLIPPVPCREDLAIVAERYFHKLGRAAEIGVYKGAFSKNNLFTWSGDYYCIDAWETRSANETGSYKVTASIMHSAMERLHRWKDRVHFQRQMSLDAARRHADGFFDWIYVDALHTYDASLADMRAWWPKLRHGGLFSGDDYADHMDTELVSARRWRHAYGPGPNIVSHWGVPRAAQQFANEVGRQLMITWMKGHTGTQPSEGNLSCYLFPAWYILK